MKRLIVILILAILAGLAFYYYALMKVDAPEEQKRNTTDTAAPSTPQPEGRKEEVKEQDISVVLFFPYQDGTEISFEKASIRAIPKTLTAADAALRALFAGPTTEEMATGFINPFTKPGAATGGSSILEYYHGVTVEGTIATVDFSEEAMGYLNSSPAASGILKRSIEKTLLQFSTVKEVRYSIDRKVITDWDA